MGDRKMIYPYTLPGKIAIFPFKFYYNNSMFFKYTCWSVFLCAPFFWKMQQLSCSEENYAKFREYRRKEVQEMWEHRQHQK